MILDRLENAGQYRALGQGLAKGLAFLAETDFCGREDGRLGIEGSDLYAILMSYKTRPPEEAVWEAHRKYMDIQCVLAGAERIGWANLGELEPDGEYDPDKDAIYLRGVGSLFAAKAGTFAVFGPQDAHMPGIALGPPGLVRKVVVKVRVG